jgi:hypothetical protein
VSDPDRWFQVQRWGETHRWGGTKATRELPWGPRRGRVWTIVPSLRLRRVSTRNGDDGVPPGWHRRHSRHHGCADRSGWRALVGGAVCGLGGRSAASGGSPVGPVTRTGTCRRPLEGVGGEGGGAVSVLVGSGAISHLVGPDAVGVPLHLGARRRQGRGSGSGGWRG